MFRNQFERHISNIDESISLKCRCCLKEEQKMNFLFTSFYRHASLARLIEETLVVAVDSLKDLPQFLCQNCTRILMDFVNFKNKFEETALYLNNIFDVKKCLGREQELHSEIFLQDKLFTESSEHKNNFKPGIITEMEISNQSESKIECNEMTNEVINFDQSEATSNILNLELDTACLANDGGNEKLCRDCKQYFPEQIYLAHIEVHKTHICKTCGHKFRRKTDLNDHEETHLNVCKYVCQHCGKAFKVRTALNKHKRIHTNPREEICDVCGQRFNSRDTLKTHFKLKHLKLKNFQCYLCGLAFTLKSTLEKHVERHNPNRQNVYTCDFCDAAYKNKYNLRRHHLIKHTSSENRPICEFCGKAYIMKIDLIKHIKKHHKYIDNVPKAE